MRTLDEILGHLRAGDVRGHGRRHRAQLRRAHSDHHSVGLQSLHRDADPPRARGNGRRILGLLDARRHVGRRHGVYLRSRGEGASAGTPAAIMRETKRRLEHAVPFAMEPVVYDFAINEHGTAGRLCSAATDALMPAGYYTLAVPAAAAHRDPPAFRRPRAPNWTASQPPAAPRRNCPAWCSTLFDHLLPQARRTCRRPAREPRPRCSTGTASTASSTSRSRPICAADASAWRRIAFPPPAASPTWRPATSWMRPPACRRAIAQSGRRRWPMVSVAVVTLAGGAGSRWTKGAGVVKALHPFCKLAGRHRNFIEAHLAKSRRTGRIAGTHPPHVITTSYLTHDAIAELAARPMETTATPAPCRSRRDATSGCAWSPWCGTCDLRGRKWRSNSSTTRRRRCAKACTPRLIAWARQAGEARELYRQPA